jgi:hypothetical protein
MIMVRYADDIVVGFQHESDARRFWDATRDRLREFSLALHPDKTRLIEFGRLAAQNCKRRGRSKPETFKFLGFVLICSGRRASGHFRRRRTNLADSEKRHYGTCASCSWDAGWHVSSGCAHVISNSRCDDWRH